MQQRTWGALSHRLTSLRKKLNTSKAMCVTLYNHLLGTLYCCWWIACHFTPVKQSVWHCTIICLTHYIAVRDCMPLQTSIARSVTIYNHPLGTQYCSWWSLSLLVMACYSTPVNQFVTLYNHLFGTLYCSWWIACNSTPVKFHSMQKFWSLLLYCFL